MNHLKTPLILHHYNQFEEYLLDYTLLTSSRVQENLHMELPYFIDKERQRLCNFP